MMKKIFILTAALLISACGFTPMHSQTLSGGSPAFKNITVEMGSGKGVGTIANSEGEFWVQQSLYDRLGKNDGAHILEIAPVFQRRSLGISSDDVATRYDMTVRLPFVLKEKKSGKILDRGSVSATSTFGAPSGPYGRSVAEQTATRNVAAEAADNLMSRLAAYYANARK